MGRRKGDLEPQERSCRIGRRKGEVTPAARTSSERHHHRQAGHLGHLSFSSSSDLDGNVTHCPTNKEQEADYRW
ncbi:hypothetical protein EJB05_13041, partial [Eragrostis curvula]